MTPSVKSVLPSMRKMALSLRRQQSEEGMDSGDKATNKAMSIAFKYACFQVFCIPTEEMQDPDADTPDPIKPLQQEPSFVPATTDQLHKMNEFVSAYADMCEECAGG